MSSEWCKEYIKLSITSKAIERECSKIRNKVFVEGGYEDSKRKKTTTAILLGRGERNGSSLKSISDGIEKMINKKYPTTDSSSSKDDRKRIYSRRCKLHRHCDTIKKTLREIKQCNNTTQQSRSSFSMEKLKKLCKHAVNSYEKEYESLREFCKCEIENLETQIKEVSQTLLSIQQQECILQHCLV